MVNCIKIRENGPYVRRDIIENISSLRWVTIILLNVGPTADFL